MEVKVAKMEGSAVTTSALVPLMHDGNGKAVDFFFYQLMDFIRGYCMTLF
jgi:hypothetical protein